MAMSGASDENIEDDDTSVATSSAVECSGSQSLEPPEDACGKLKNGIKKLEVELSSVRTKLAHCLDENEILHIKLKSAKQDEDILENTEVKKLIKQYQDQVDDLKFRIENCRKSSDFRAYEENIALKKRNRLALNTNAVLAQKVADLTRELQAYRDNNMQLDQQFALLQISASETRQVASQNSTTQGQQLAEDCKACFSSAISPTTDECASEQSCATHPPTDKPQTEVSDLAQQNARLQGYLQNYYHLVREGHTRNEQLEREAQLYRQKIANQEETLKKLCLQMDVVVKERDQLLNQSNFNDHSISEGPVSAGETGRGQNENVLRKMENQIKELKRTSSEYEDHVLEQEEKIEKLMKVIAYANNERDRLKAELEGLQSGILTSPEPCNLKDFEQLQKDYKKLDDENQRKNRSIIELGKKINNLRDENQALKIEIDNLTDTKDSSNVSPKVYEDQIKAFQDDWLAEHEEKVRVLRHNEELRLELEKNRLSQNQLSPPHSFESTTLQSPPIRTHPGEHPGSMTVYPATEHPPYVRSNTIPPRNAYHAHPAHIYDRSMSQNQGNYIPPAHFQQDRAATHQYPGHQNPTMTRGMEGHHGDPRQRNTCEWQNPPR